MSVKVNYGSEIIEKLPTVSEPIHPEEYARIAPLLDESSKLVRPLKRYLLIAILFVVLSLHLVDTLLVSVFPTLGINPFLPVLAKAFGFMIIIYITDNFISGK